MPKLLTVVFNTLNDNYEAIQTVRSINKTAGDQVDIVVVDDCSDTRFEMPEGEAPNLKIIRVPQRIGVGPTRHVGVSWAKTPYVLITDSHMRFSEGWYEAAAKVIPGRDRTIHCAQCLGLDASQGMDLSKHKGTYNGATLNLFGRDPNNAKITQVFEGVWAPDKPGEDDYELACVMGACYFVPTEWFFHIGGLRLLRQWGVDEPYLSVKTWLAGGECRMLKGVKIGHKFREQVEKKFNVDVWCVQYNKMVAMMTIMPPKLSGWLSRHLPADVSTKRAAEVVKQDSHAITAEYHYLKAIAEHDFDWYCKKFGIKLPEI